MFRMTLTGILVLSICVTAKAQAKSQTTSGGDYLDVGGVKLWYEACGTENSNAPNVVLLHDGLLDSVTWDGIWAPLCAKYRVVRYDRRGYGRSEPSKSAFVPEDDLNKVMRQVRMDRAILVGNSSGSGLALDFAIAHPEMVEGLFLIGPVVHGMPSSAYFNERGNRNSEPLAHGDAKAAAENWSQDRFLISGPNPQARKQLYDGLVRNSQNLTVAGRLEIRPSPPTVVRLGEIHVLTLVLVGDADIADVIAYAGAIEADVPLATMEVWKDTGHMIQLQKPADLVTRFNRFVPFVTRKEVAVSEHQLSSYAGRYACSGLVVSTHLLDHRLALEIPGEPYKWLFAASGTRFFLRTSAAEIEFEANAAGESAAMAVHNSDGSVIRCPRKTGGTAR